ncbi:CHASE domain-containing protein [uncultured Methylibium sp.]|uniref:CHASE domain-containing protein n=1 Tax=uncultured Methylibium sp. TaxID=381093 RepID=UPI0025F6EF72|nr:CHASE domain-containing protein [uncultured Methylibium sp.]
MAEPAAAAHTDAPPPGAVSAGALLLVALAYALTGSAALQLAIPPGYASPLFPPAGVALAAALVFGWRALPAVLLGSLGVQAVRYVIAGPDAAGPNVLPLALVIALGAAAQAGVGAWLARRVERGPLTLDSPASIGRLFGLGGMLACTINATTASLALWLAGAIGPAQLPYTWWTWWGGDVLGVVIATPVMLSFIGRPRAAWRPRRNTVALPLTLATLLLAAAILQVTRWDAQRGAARFERDALGVSRGVELRLGAHLDALDAMHGIFIASSSVEPDEFRRASVPWLRKLPSVQALGWHQRVPREQVAGFEAQVRDGGNRGFRVFERDASLTAADSELLVMRFVEPAKGNDSALGVNVLSIRAAREAIAQARQDDAPVATSSFRLTQETGQQTGVVVYRAIHSDDGPQRQLVGLVFLTLRMADALGALMAGAPSYLEACLVDTQGSTQPAVHLAGPAGCEAAPANGVLQERVAMPFAGRAWELRLTAPHGVPATVVGPLASDSATTWLFSITGLAATGLMGVLLLLVTGRTRLTEAAVGERTEQLEHEIAERQLTEQALRVSEQRFRGIFNAVPIGVVYTDLQGRIKQPNAAYCAMLGYTEEELLSLSVTSLTHRDDRTDDLILKRDLVAGRTPLYRRRKRYMTKAGQPLWVSVTISVLRDERGEPHRLLGLVEDISEHLRLEEAERARESAENANRAKDEFLSRMSHELRTPLNAMLGFAQLLDLDRGEPLHERHRLWVTQIQQAGWHLLEMINDVLDLSRIESGTLNLQIEPLAVEPLIAASMALVEPQAQARGVTLVRAMADHAPLQVMGDVTRVKQILTNLLSNAVKYNREGGEVRVATRVGKAADDTPVLELDVVDTGMGIDAQQLSQLFQPFNRLGRERSATEGTGIGLVIAKLLAERQDGSLDVRSEVGVGSTFTLRLPLDTQASDLAPAELPAATDDPAYHRRQVLYIEDNETNVEVMRGIFNLRPQVEFTVATTGLDGLAAVRTAPPDLVLLDMNLPDIGGMALLQHLQADPLTADIPVVVVSADALPAQIAATLRAGATRYLTKPVAVDEMLAVLDEQLSQMTTRFG